LVTLTYKTNGYVLPRNANDIFNASQNITQPLLTGDLIFFAHPSQPDFMFHVMMVADAESILESSVDSPDSEYFMTMNNMKLGGDNGTRIVKSIDRFGLSLSQLGYGKTIPESFGGYLTYWGTFISRK